MSGPTKGMVAGQPIKTGAQSKEFDEGFERTFGERKPSRGRFVYTSGGKPLEEPVQVSGDWADPARESSHRSEEEIYGRVVATDGTVLDSRTKHRRYMQENGLEMASDFKEHWKQAAQKREAVLSGEADTKERREIIGRTLHEARRKR